MKTIILISGKMRSGKNTFSSFLKDLFNKEFKTTEMAFADDLKLFCYEKFDGLNKAMNYTYKNWDTFKDDVTRAILQSVGTNIMQEYVDKDFWIKKLIAKLDDLEKDIFLITDLRYEHELERVAEWAEKNQHKIYTIRINSARLQKEHSKKLEEHTSETALDDYPNFSYIVENNEGIEVLKDSARVVFEDIKEDRENV